MYIPALTIVSTNFLPILSGSGSVPVPIIPTIETLCEILIRVFLKDKCLNIANTYNLENSNTKLNTYSNSLSETKTKTYNKNNI